MTVGSLCTTFIFFIILCFPTQVHAIESNNWNDDWKFKQDLPLTIDTSLSGVQHQPVDIRISFEHDCYARDETHHAIRVVCYHQESFDELEIQIYDLQRIDETYIAACSLVFLIPSWADGTEIYSVYYTDEVKDPPAYQDYVSITESQYYYEPIPGYPLESKYYKITDDGYVSYAISQTGQFMSYNTGQHIIKMKENVTEIQPQNQELFVGFDFQYYYDEGLFDYSSTSQQLVFKEILIDGNLMIQCRMISRSKLNDIETTVIYQYYHCPTDTKRIHAHVHHETKKDIQVVDDVNTDGTLALMQCGGVRSNAIRELNFGEILPYLYLYSESERVIRYPLDLDPEYRPDDPDIRVINTKDDVDLGTQPWVSFSQGEKGRSHALIFESNSVETSRTNHRSGLQINAFQMDYPHLPGLENNIATVEIGRNSYEPSDGQNLHLPKGYTLDFHAEFYSSVDGGYYKVMDEAKVFQQIIQMKPEMGDGTGIENEKTETYNISVFVHNAPSFPFGSAFSALLGKNVSYITAEIYQNSSLLHSGTMRRLPFDMITDDEQNSFIEKIRTSVQFFDFKNATVMKSITFHGIKEGTYVIKIFKEHPRFHQNRVFLGFAIVNLPEDKTRHIFCSSQGSVHLRLIDQKNQGVKDTHIQLLYEDMPIAVNITNERGICIIDAPYIADEYKLKIQYHDNVIYSEGIHLKRRIHFFPTEKTIQIKRYTFNVHLSDAWNLSPDVNLNPLLFLKSAGESSGINGMLRENDTFVFSNITSGWYQLFVKYKSFVMNQSVEIVEDSEYFLFFPAEYTINLQVFDNHGLRKDATTLIVTRGNKQMFHSINSSSYDITIPPGTYTVQIMKDGKNIWQQDVLITSERSFDLITFSEPLFPFYVMIISLAVLSGAFLVYYKKREMPIVVIGLGITLLLVSMSFPWWTFGGVEQEVEIYTNMYIIPVTLVTLVSGPNIQYGELSYLPDLFINTIELIPILTIIGLLLVIIAYYLQKKKRKLLALTFAIISVILLCASLAMFTVGVHMLSEVGVGGFIGSGDIYQSIGNQAMKTKLHAQWGPSIGFYLYIFAISCFIVEFLLIMKGFFFMKKHNENHEQ